MTPYHDSSVPFPGYAPRGDLSCGRGSGRIGCFHVRDCRFGGRFSVQCQICYCTSHHASICYYYHFRLLLVILLTLGTDLRHLFHRHLHHWIFYLKLRCLLMLLHLVFILPGYESNMEPRPSSAQAFYAGPDGGQLDMFNPQLGILTPVPVVMLLLILTIWLQAFLFLVLTRYMLVMNGQGIPIMAVSSTSHPHTNFTLINLLLVPSITKNLVSVSQFAKDNNVYFEFHPSQISGFFLSSSQGKPWKW